MSKPSTRHLEDALRGAAVDLPQPPINDALHERILTGLSDTDQVRRTRVIPLPLATLAAAALLAVVMLPLLRSPSPAPEEAAVPVVVVPISAVPADTEAAAAEQTPRPLALTLEDEIAGLGRDLIRLGAFIEEIVPAVPPTM